MADFHKKVARSIQDMCRLELKRDVRYKFCLNLVRNRPTDGTFWGAEELAAKLFDDHYETLKGAPLRDHDDREGSGQPPVVARSDLRTLKIGKAR